MTTLSEMEALIDETERIAQQVHSKELRKAIDECVKEQRELLKALRRLYN